MFGFTAWECFWIACIALSLLLAGLYLFMGLDKGEKGADLKSKELFEQADRDMLYMVVFLTIAGLIYGLVF